MNKMTMIKTLMVAASMIAATNVANATVSNNREASSCTTERETIQLNKFKDNWFIGIGGGINTYYGNHTSYVPFGRRISPMLTLQAGKWFTPFIGFRGNFAWSNTISADINANNPDVYTAYKNAYKTKADMISLHAETMFNVTNLIFGYKEKRVYNFIPYLGAGWIRNCHANADKITASFGLLNEFRLNDKFSLNFDLRANAFGEGLDRTVPPLVGKTSDLNTSFTIGATYHFKKRGFNTTQISNFEIQNLQNDLRNLNDEKASLQRELATAKRFQPEQKEVVKTQYASSDVAVFFTINKSDLSVKDKVNLGFIANMIKNNPEKTFVITGYADKATGSAEFNDKLSAARAQSVYDTLVNDFNVNSNQLEISHMGGVDNMFYDNKQLSRVAIIKMK